MSFINSLFKFLLPLLLSTTALSKSPQYPHIEPVDIPKEILESYRKLVDQSLFTNITEYLLYRAQYVAKFYIEGEDFLIPEYAVVINMCIKYLNHFHPRDGDDFFLERKVYSGLLNDIKIFRDSGHYPYNLKYSKVIDFLVRTALMRSRALSNHMQRSLFENLILNDVPLNMNHFYVSSYYDPNDTDSLGSNYKGHTPQYSHEILTLLKSRFKPIKSWMLPNQEELSDTPKDNNLFNMVFYFIHTNQDHLHFREFRRTEGSHFIDLLSLFSLGNRRDQQLWKYIIHDLSHLSESIHNCLTKDLLIASNSPNKETDIQEYLEKITILQGSMWDSLDKFFKDQDSENLVDMSGGLESFIYWFFDTQHENTLKSLINNFSPTSYNSIFNFLDRYYDKYKKYFDQENISLKSFRNMVGIRFNKHLEKNYPQYLSERFLP